MPNAEKFLRGFKLIAGNRFNDFKITSSYSTHKVIVRYHKYEYNITLKLKKITNDKDENLDDLIRHINKNNQKKRIIYSNYNNPYECYIENITKKDARILNDEIIITMKGFANRIYN